MELSLTTKVCVILGNVYKEVTDVGGDFSRQRAELMFIIVH